MSSVVLFEPPEALSRLDREVSPVSFDPREVPLNRNELLERIRQPYLTRSFPEDFRPIPGRV